MVAELKLAELLCTRLCHDLTGPIGAVANGAEFLGDEGFDMQGQALELINSSAASAVARLQFYRKAYGRVNHSGEADIADHKKITLDFFNGTKVQLDWPDMHTDASGVSVSHKMARLLLNLIIIASGALLRGGDISVRIHADDASGKSLTIAARGVSIKWDKDIEEALQTDVDLKSLTPKTVQAYLTRTLAEELSADLSYTVSDAEVVFMVKQPLHLKESDSDIQVPMHG